MQMTLTKAAYFKESLCDKNGEYANGRKLKTMTLQSLLMT